MSKKFLIIALLLLALIVLINYLIITPKSINFVETQLRGRFIGYVAYKNNQKGFYLYLTDDSSVVARLNLDTLYEGEAFRKPQLGEYIKHIIFTDSLLYQTSRLSDRIEKLANSNKCYLFTSKGTFRFNCYVISDDKRKEIGEIDEWKPDELGFWKNYSK